MKWYKRLSNGLLALIVVAIIAFVVFVALALIVPKVKQNYAADGFFVALFKDPPRNEHIVYDQDRTTGEITLSVNAPADYEVLELQVKLCVPRADGKYTDADIITYIDENGLTKKEQKLFKFSNIKKGVNKSPDSFLPNTQTLTTYKNYAIIIEVVKYK